MERFKSRLTDSPPKRVAGAGTARAAVHVRRDPHRAVAEGRTSPAGVEPFPVYSIRHFMLSAALARGVAIEVLAVLAGNSPAVIRANYSKLGDDVMAPVLAEAAARAVS